MRAWTYPPDSLTLWCRGQLALAAMQLTVELMQGAVEVLAWREERLR